jgi:hypothetical protein
MKYLFHETSNLFIEIKNMILSNQITKQLIQFFLHKFSIYSHRRINI